MSGDSRFHTILFGSVGGGGGGGERLLLDLLDTVSVLSFSGKILIFYEISQ